PPLEGPPPDRTLWPWLLGLVLLVLGALLGCLLFHNSGHHKQRTVTRSAASERVVPGVVGRSQVEAARRVTQAGLVPKIVPRDSAKPPGNVVAQKPGGGAQLKAGSPVTLVVSRGKGSVAVPNVVGIPVTQAVTHLAAAGLQANRQL